MAGRKWTVKKPDESAVQALVRAGYPKVLAKLLVNRGMTDAGEARRFLSCEGELHDPMLLKGMDGAVRRIQKALETGEKIVVYGDYDVDGVTATALLYSFLKGKGADVFCYIPQRESEGYGLNEKAVRKIRGEGVSLLVTVDTGISAMNEVEFSRGLGLDVVITDHHEPRGKELPRAKAVVDPKQPGCPYPFKGLAGVGVAFQLACALEGKADALFEKYGGLAALGTVADVVPLTGENRLLAGKGIALLQKRQSYGVHAILEAAGVKTDRISSRALGFSAAPRINAAGRMGSACDALSLLLARDADTARLLAEKLDGFNRRRQEIESEILVKAREKIGSDESGRNSRVLIVGGEGWHEGVIGIVASKLTEEYGKPAIVISFEGDEGRASCRSFPGFNIHDALLSCEKLLIRFGGHALAAGFSIRRENVAAFREAIEDYARALPKFEQPGLELEWELSAGELSLESARECEKLEPCGEGNPAPLFCIRAALIKAITPLKGGKHLRLTLAKGGVSFRALLFGADKTGFDYQVGEPVDLAAELSVNRYNGRESLSVIIRDFAKSPVYDREAELYREIVSGKTACPPGHVPNRDDFAAVYRYLFPRRGETVRLRRACDELCGLRAGFTYVKLLLILKVFQQVRLMEYSTREDAVTFEINNGKKVNLKDSGLLRSVTGCENQRCG